MQQRLFDDEAQYVKELPNCESCQDQPAGYFCPTTRGRWMNLCSTCRPSLQSKNGKQLINTPLVEAEELTPLHRIATDTASRKIACPICHKERIVDAEASHTIICYLCHTKLKLKKLF